MRSPNALSVRLYHQLGNSEVCILAGFDGVWILLLFYPACHQLNLLIPRWFRPDSCQGENLSVPVGALGGSSEGSSASTAAARHSAAGGHQVGLVL
jgi:hypothetical protein